MSTLSGGGMRARKVRTGNRQGKHLMMISFSELVCV